MDQLIGDLTSMRSVFLSSPDAFREVPLFPAWSSSNSLVRAISIASSLLRRNSFFFRPRTDRPLSDAHDKSQPSFGRTCRPQRESGESEILSSVSAVEMRSAIVFSFDSAKRRIWSCFLALASSLRQMNLPPAPSNPQAIAPA